MKVELTDHFIKLFKKRIAGKRKLHQRFEEATRQFEENPHHPTLKNHALSGKLKGYHAFWITGDIRVIYRIERNTAYFENIGTHNQVY